MITLQSQLDFVDVMHSLDRGRNVELDPWVKQSYDEWVQANPNHALFDPELQVESFVEFMRKAYIKKASELAGEEGEKAAKRGLAILITRDHGEHFECLTGDQILEFENKPELVEVFSPTLSGARRDLNVLLKEQRIVTVLSTLKQHQFLVSDLDQQGSSLVMQAIHPKGSYVIKTDLSDLEEAIKFEIQASNRPELAREYLATQLPEDFGTPAEDLSLSASYQKKKLLEMRLAAMENASAADAADRALRAGIAAKAAEEISDQVKKARLASLLGQAPQAELEGAPVDQREREATATRRMTQVQERQKAQAEHVKQLQAYNQRLEAQQQIEMKQKKRQEEIEVKRKREQKRRRTLAGSALGAGLGTAGLFAGGAIMGTATGIVYHGTFIASLLIPLI